MAEFFSWANSDELGGRKKRTESKSWPLRPQHGLGGDHSSSYLQRIAHQLRQRNTRVWRVDLLGSGHGFNLGWRPAHAGCSRDLLAVLEHAARLYPEAPLRLVGFSLSGNILLKLLGELAADLHPLSSIFLRVATLVTVGSSSMEQIALDFRTDRSNTGDMIGRPKNFDQQVALQAATDLFWRRGYTATSLDDLLGVMSLSKSSFYAEFKSKEALYRACLKDYQQMIVCHLDQVRSGTSSLRDFLDAIFQEAIDDATSGDPKGCLIVNSAVEFGQHKTQFTKDVRVALEAIQKAFESAIQMAVRNGEFATTSSPKLLANAITTLMSGVRTMIKGGMPTRDAKAVAQKVLDSLLT